MLEHVVAIAVMLFIVAFSSAAVWLNYRQHAMEADRATGDIRERACDRPMARASYVAPRSSAA